MPCSRSITDPRQECRAVLQRARYYLTGIKDYLEGLAYGPKENLRHIKIYTAQGG